MAKVKTGAALKEPETSNKKAVSAEPEPPRSEGFPAPKDEQPGVERIAFKIVDGKLDTASLRPSTAGRAKEVVQKSLSDSEFRKYFGLEHKPEAIPQLISPVLVGGALNVVAYFETGALVKKTGLTRDEVRQFTEWTAEEHAQLDKQGADLCNKYIPPEYLKYADITLFFGTMLVLIDAKSKMVERYAKKRLEQIGRAPSHDEERKEPPPQPNPAPAPNPTSSPSPTTGAAAAPASNNGRPLLVDSIAPEDRSRSLE
jgi:hypothetical protein